MVGIIVQARMGSTRLPGKTMKLIENRPLLSYSISACKKVKYSDFVVIATTKKDEDEEIQIWASQNQIPCYRGSSDDVLDRYYKAAKKYNLDLIVRVTADNPFIDEKIIDYLILNMQLFDYDYICMRNKTNTWPYGLDVEVVSINALERAWSESEEPCDREHVTSYIKSNVDKFSALELPYNKDLSDIRLTVDYKEDFIRAKELIINLKKEFGSEYNWMDVVEMYKKIDHDKYSDKID